MTVLKKESENKAKGGAESSEKYACNRNAEARMRNAQKQQKHKIRERGNCGNENSSTCKAGLLK